MNKKYLWLMSIAGIIIAIDQLIKLYIHTTYQLGDSVVVIPHFFNITYVRNPGAAFGFLAETHPGFRDIFFLLMPPIALAVILMILRGVSDKDTRQIVALSMIFGGAIGNYIDRLRFHYVIDFLDFHYKNSYSYPAFNVADSAIVVGVGILMLLMFLENKDKSAKPNSKEENKESLTKA